MRLLKINFIKNKFLKISTIIKKVKKKPPNKLGGFKIGNDILFQVLP